MQLSEYRKTIVSVIMGILVIADQRFGFKGAFLNMESSTTILAVLWAILVYFVPNAGPERLR